MKNRKQKLLIKIYPAAILVIVIVFRIKGGELQEFCYRWNFRICLMNFKEFRIKMIKKGILNLI